MSRKKDIDLDLTGFAELFMNDEGRAESRLPRIYGCGQKCWSQKSFDSSRIISIMKR